MPIQIPMPRLSDTMEMGTVVKWNVKPGDKVRPGDVIADIETDKATMELQSFDDGVVSQLPVNEGQSVKVGTVILVLDGGESVAASAPVAPEQRRNSEPDVKAATPVAPVAHAASNGASTDRVFASPLARKVAAETNVDLGSIRGSGPSGRIVKRDVEAALGSVSATTSAASRTTPGQRPAPTPEIAQKLVQQVIPLSNMRATIAKRLVQSKTTIPHYQVTVAVRMDALLSLRTQLNDQLGSQGVKLSVNDFLVRACALAMHQHPHINSRFVDGPAGSAVEVLADVNIGIAIALPMERGGGLVVATLRGSDHMGLRQISTQSKILSEKARTKGLTIEEMSDSTFTISNLGMFGVDHFTAIINPPNTAILAVGAAIEKAVVETDSKTSEKRLVIGSEMSMTMSSDHRVIDGAMAARYLASVKQYLEAPATLLV